MRRCVFCQKRRMRIVPCEFKYPKRMHICTSSESYGLHLIRQTNPPEQQCPLSCPNDNRVMFVVGGCKQLRLIKGDSSINVIFLLKIYCWLDVCLVVSVCACLTAMSYGDLIKFINVRCLYRDICLWLAACKMLLQIQILSEADSCIHKGKSVSSPLSLCSQFM